MRAMHILPILLLAAAIAFAAGHGENGDAQPGLGRTLAPHPWNFTSAREMAGVTDEEMTGVILYIRTKFTPSANVEGGAR